MADTPWQRARGWIGQRPPAEGQGLWLRPCNGIHTFGMWFGIDVLALDSASRILRIATNVRPNRIILPCLSGKSVLELPAGAIQETKITLGDRIVFVAAEEDDDFS